MIQYSDKYILWFLFLALPLAALLFFYLRKRKKNIQAFATDYLFKKIAPGTAYTRTVLKPILVLIAILVLIYGLSGPRFGNVEELSAKQAADIVIALDVSRSMLAEDVLPNRLEKAKTAISTLLRKLDGDRVALVVFAGKAYIQMPLTSDYASGEMFLDAIDTDMIPVQGTALADAIKRSRECFPKEEENPTSHAIILITDGENHEDNPIEEAKLAKEEGAVIYTVGIGDPNGTQLPIYQDGLVVGYKKDKQGNTVLSKLNEKILVEMAQATGGTYVHGNNTIAALDKVLKEIESLEKQEKSTKRFSENENRYQFFLLFAILLLAAEYFIPEKRSLKKRVKRLFQ